MTSIKISAPAKLNLALDITGIREDGYHFVDMILQSIALHDTVTLSKSKHYHLTCDNPLIPTNEDNLATKATKLFFNYTQLNENISISIEKKISILAGMGGGSANAAAVLWGLNELYQTKLKQQELLSLGLQLGADVPFMILGGTARATGIGEVLQPELSLPSCFIVITMPPMGNATQCAYQQYDLLGSPVKPNINNLVDGLRKQNLSMIAKNMENVLEYSNGGKQTEDIKQLFKKSGALNSMMTGSGAAIFGLFTQKKSAEEAINIFKKKGLQTFLTIPTQKGIHILDDE